MWELDCEESWVLKNWCFWTVVLEKTLESPLDCKEIQSVHPKGDHSWVFTGRTDAETETPILWPPDVKSWLIGKDPDAGKEGRQEKGTTEDEMVGWHQCTWVWVNSGSWWWTWKPGVLQSMRSHRDWHNWKTELNWKDTFQEFRTMEQDVYWKQDLGLRVLHWLPSNFYLTGITPCICASGDTGSIPG